MEITLFLTDAMSQWLKVDLPPVSGHDSLSAGTRLLASDEDAQIWQCHVIKSNERAGHAMIIAVEARSGYVILIPADEPVTTRDIEQLLVQRWTDEMVYLAQKAGVMTDEMVAEVYRQYQLSAITFQWVNHVEPGLNHHIANAEYWVSQALAHRAALYLVETEAITLGLYINRKVSQDKRIGDSNNPLCPVTRFVDDLLYRVAKRLMDDRYPGGIRREASKRRTLTGNVSDGEHPVKSPEPEASMEDLSREAINRLARGILSRGNTGR